MVWLRVDGTRDDWGNTMTLDDMRAAISAPLLADLPGDTRVMIRVELDLEECLDEIETQEDLAEIAVVDTPLGAVIELLM